MWSLPSRLRRFGITAPAILLRRWPQKRISSVELVDQAILRIEKLDNRTNAVAVRDFERARAAPIAADAVLARGERRPLLGLPIRRPGAISLPLADCGNHLRKCPSRNQCVTLGS